MTKEVLTDELLDLVADKYIASKATMISQMKDMSINVSESDVIPFEKFLEMELKDRQSGVGMTQWQRAKELVF